MYTKDEVVNPIKLLEKEDELIAKVISWTVTSCEAIQMAGGNPSIILGNVPTNVLITLIRNNIQFTYKT